MIEHSVATRVNAHNVSFTYPLGTRPGIQGVSDVSFSVSSGQCLLITGDSGSGKSTVLKLINGLIPISIQESYKAPSLLQRMTRLLTLRKNRCPAPSSSAPQYSRIHGRSFSLKASMQN